MWSEPAEQRWSLILKYKAEVLVMFTNPWGGELRVKQTHTI
jgi:hypothetical protein